MQLNKVCHSTVCTEKCLTEKSVIIELVMEPPKQLQCIQAKSEHSLARHEKLQIGVTTYQPCMKQNLCRLLRSACRTTVNHCIQTVDTHAPYLFRMSLPTLVQQMRTLRLSFLAVFQATLELAGCEDSSCSYVNFGGLLYIGLFHIIVYTPLGRAIFSSPLGQPITSITPLGHNQSRVFNPTRHN